MAWFAKGAHVLTALSDTSLLPSNPYPMSTPPRRTACHCFPPPTPSWARPPRVRRKNWARGGPQALLAAQVVVDIAPVGAERSPPLVAVVVFDLAL